MKVKLMIASALLSCSTTFAATRLDVLSAKSQNINQMMVAILQQQQKPYAEGAKGEESFDATGLIVYAYKQVGLDVPYEKENLFKTGSKIKKAKNLEAGDIVFFHDGQNTKTATQVGIVQHIEKDGSFILRCGLIGVFELPEHVRLILISKQRLQPAAALLVCPGLMNR